MCIRDRARISDLANLLIQNNHKVKILTNFPHYPKGKIFEGYKNGLFMHEKKDGLDIYRTWVFIAPNKGFLKRIINHLSFMLSSLIIGSWLVGKCEVVITESPPLFLGVAGYLLSKLKRAKFIFNVADLWPESAVEIGALNNLFLIRLSNYLANFIYSKAHLITVPNASQKKILEKKDIASGKIMHISNGVNTKLFTFVNTNGFIKEYSLVGKFIVLYSGTHGMSQGLDVVLEAAGCLNDVSDLLFLFVGEGAEKDRLVRKKFEMRLKNVLFIPSQPRLRMPEIISSANICLVPLRNLKLFEGAVPSKIFEYMSCKRPIILGVKGEAEIMLEKAKAGICVQPESAKDLYQAIKRLYEDAHLREAMGNNGREYVEKHFNRKHLALKLEESLVDLTKYVGKTCNDG